MSDSGTDSSTSSDSYTYNRWHGMPSSRKRSKFRIADRAYVEPQKDQHLHAVFEGQPTAIDDDEDSVDFMKLLNDTDIFPDFYDDYEWVTDNHRRPPEATVTVAARADENVLAQSQDMDAGIGIPSEFPAPVVASRESRGTSPIPGVETALVASGTDASASAVELPDGVSLAAIVTVVVNHHGEEINQLIDHLIDRLIGDFPDSQRQTLKSLVTLAAVSFRVAGRQMHHLLSNAREEWDNLDEDVDEFQIEEFQDRIRTATEVYLNNLVRWEVPSPNFHLSWRGNRD